MDDKLSVLPVDKFRYSLGRYIEEARWNNERFMITRRGTPYAVMISVTEYEYLVSAADELAELKSQES